MSDLDLYDVDSNNIDSISEQFLYKSAYNLTYNAARISNKEEKRREKALRHVKWCQMLEQEAKISLVIA